MEWRPHWESRAERRDRTGIGTMGFKDGPTPEASMWLFSTAEKLLLLSSSGEMCADAVCRFRSGKDKVIYTTDKPTYNYIYFNFHILKAKSHWFQPSLESSLTNQRSQQVALSPLDAEKNHHKLQQGPHLYVLVFVFRCRSKWGGFVCLRVMPKMQTSRDLQYIAPGDKGGWRDEARRCSGETDTNPLLANRLSYSPEPDRERRRAGGRLTQNLSCWDYLIDVNHWFIVEILPDVFPEDAGP